MKSFLKHREPLRGGFILGAGVVEFAQLAGQPLDLALHFAQFVKDGEALLEDAAPGQVQSLLGQVANAHAACLLR